MPNYVYSQSECPSYFTIYSCVNVKHITNNFRAWKPNHLVSTSARCSFLVGGDWRCTSLSPFGLMLSTPSATPTLGKNIPQTCQLYQFYFHVTIYHYTTDCMVTSANIGSHPCTYFNVILSHFCWFCVSLSLWGWWCTCPFSVDVL